MFGHFYFPFCSYGLYDSSSVWVEFLFIFVLRQFHIGIYNQVLYYRYYFPEDNWSCLLFGMVMVCFECDVDV